MNAILSAIEYFLPEDILTNDDLAFRFSDWTSAKIEKKIGIRQRHIARADQTSLDLGIAAAKLLFDKHAIKPEDIDYLLFCTQSPDYFLPTTACIAQAKLGLSKSSGALDFNLGCSGFVYGLSLAKALIESSQAKTVLLITAETYSKFIEPNDKSNLTIFGDGAAATLILGIDSSPNAKIGPFIMGTDGNGANNLIVRSGAMREPLASSKQNAPSLYMNGPEIYSFTLQAVPAAVDELLAKSGNTLNDIDLFVFHQANQYMLERIRDKIGIPENRFVFAMLNYGNTVSSTIPIALKDMVDQGRLLPGMRVMLVGFGVGYSWAACILTWHGENALSSVG